MKEKELNREERNKTVMETGALVMAEFYADWCPHCQKMMPIVKELGVTYHDAGNGTYIMDSVHTTSALIYQATKAGATIFNCYSVEDVVFHNDAVAGVVVNWAPVIREGITLLHSMDLPSDIPLQALDATGQTWTTGNPVDTKKERIPMCFAH